jgi:predicted Zn finger-like uncharacterized protein
MPGRDETRVITRCPQCATAFRISRAQLDARAGQVRCGSCSGVFNASSHLVEDTATETTVPLESPQPDTVAVENPIQSPGSPFTLPMFDSVPQKKPVGAAWLIGCVVLVIVLIGQLLFQFRGDLAIMLPQAKPVLKETCRRLGCTLPLPRRVELISIDASDLQADGANPNVMVLTATLRNRAPFPQVHPAIELTLTDAQDLPLARRVLSPADYLGAPPDAEAGFTTGAEAAVRVPIQLAGIKATGYRLYLFYP